MQQTDLFEAAVFDGANLTVVHGQYLVDGLLCEYSSSVLSTVIYRNLTLTDSARTKGECDVPTSFF